MLRALRISTETQRHNAANAAHKGDTKNKFFETRRREAAVADTKDTKKMNNRKTFVNLRAHRAFVFHIFFSLCELLCALCVFVFNVVFSIFEGRNNVFFLMNGLQNVANSVKLITE
jgi:hypothetical protein